MLILGFLSIFSAEAPGLYRTPAQAAPPPKLMSVLTRLLLLGSSLASRRSSGPFLPLTELQTNKATMQCLSF